MATEPAHLDCTQCPQRIWLPMPFQVVSEANGMVWLRAGLMAHMAQAHGAT